LPTLPPPSAVQGFLTGDAGMKGKAYKQSICLQANQGKERGRRRFFSAGRMISLSTGT
jgi:hypothetical protein